jgi:hypothetical protein
MWNETFIPPRAGKGASVGLTLLLALFAVWASPFAFDEGASGRYLPGVEQALDPTLFPGDAVVEGMRRFKSLFYTGLGVGARPFGVAGLELLLGALYALSKLLLALAVLLVIRRLTTDWRASLLAVAWIATPKSCWVGGVTLFLPTLTHMEVALGLGLVGVWLLLEGRLNLFWLVSALSVFVHPLVTFHLLLAVFPLLNRRKQLPGFLVFAVCAAVYVLTMAPHLSAEEGQIFLAAKGHINHISLLNQGAFGWVKLLAVTAVVVRAQYKDGDGKTGMLLGCVLAGFASALALSALALATHSVSLALFQPMRVFFWVTLFLGLLLAVFAAKDRLLLIVLLLWMLDSLWMVPFAALIFVGREDLIRYGTWLLTALAAAALFVHTPFESTREVAPALVLFLLSIPSGWVVVPALALTLYGAALHRKVPDADWTAVRRWASQNTAKGDRFVTPPGAENFRAVALRSSLTEGSSALAWVEPRLYVEGERDAADALADPFGFAERRGARYVIQKTDCPGGEAYRAGAYRVCVTDGGR